MTALAQSAMLGRGDQVPSAEDCASLCFQQLRSKYEPKFGGFSKAPKFPQPVNMNLLLRWHLMAEGSDARSALDMCAHTLRMMAKGGIFDHVSLVTRNVLSFVIQRLIVFTFFWPGFRSLFYRRRMARPPF